MKWGPKDWDWAPRLDELFGWLARNVPRALLFPIYALLNIDRWPWRRIWQALGWLPRNYFAVLAVLAVVVLPFWMWLIVQVAAKVIDLLGPLPAGGTAEERRDLAYAFGVNVAALAGLVAAPLVIIRAWVSERHTKTAEEGLITDRFTKAVEQLGAEKTVKVEGRIVRYRYGPKGKPLSSLEIRGEPLNLHDAAEIVDTDDWQLLERTVPNLEVRLGAIYALERIAQDSERDHIPIMETLCAYIRENAPASSAQGHNLGEWPDWQEDELTKSPIERKLALEARSEAVREWANALPAPRVDVQAALSVIGRRSEDQIAYERRHRKSDEEHEPYFRLDLHGANLQRANLNNARLDDALMSRTRLEGARLNNARLERAALSWARLEGAVLGGETSEGSIIVWATPDADLGGARLQNSNLSGARLECAILVGALFDRAMMIHARLEGTDLFRARLDRAHLNWARLEGARLESARLERATLNAVRLEGADLNDTNFKEAELRECFWAGASLRSADFTDAQGITQADFNSAFGDSATILPAGINMPDHWDEEALEPLDEDQKYKEWLDAGAPAGKPRADRA